MRPSGAASHLDLFEQPAGFPRILLGRRALPPAGVRDSVGAYAELSKLGIVLLVLVSACAGFMLAARRTPLARSGWTVAALGGLQVALGIRAVVLQLPTAIRAAQDEVGNAL